MIPNFHITIELLLSILKIKFKFIHNVNGMTKVSADPIASYT